MGIPEGLITLDKGEDVPTLFIGASSLPRGAMVEVQGMGCYFVPQDDDYSEVSSRVVTTKMGELILCCAASDIVY